MLESLQELEQQRSALFQQMFQLPDFRSGSITPTRGTCGKPNCHCHQRSDPGHGPNFRLTRKVNGKTITETFASEAERQKAQREVEAYHRFRLLAQQLLAVNEKICRARPLGEELPPSKKTAAILRQEVQEEVEHLLERIFSEHQKTGRLDLEAVEMAMRSAVHQAGAAALSELLQFGPPGPGGRQRPCPCGYTAQYLGLRSKPVLTAVGPVEVSRPYSLCSSCHTGQLPVDVELDIEDTEFSPGVRGMQALVGQ